MEEWQGSGTAIPPCEQWPESLAELAAEVGRRTGDLEAARREVWISWRDWSAKEKKKLRRKKTGEWQ